MALLLYYKVYFYLLPHSGELLPMTSTNLIRGPCNEMSMFISEQIINNSELLINMNRITDKFDAVLDKISNR